MPDIFLFDKNYQQPYTTQGSFGVEYALFRQPLRLAAGEVVLVHAAASGVGTAALIFKKGAPTESVWFYDVMADGFSLDDKRTPIERNDIPDVIAKWPSRDEGPQSYRVPLAKIEENDWSLAAGRYKAAVASVANHDAPIAILEDVLAIEGEIEKRGKVLLAQLGGDL